MKRRHTMPFGAELAADGSTRFRLWAPAARSVELDLSVRDLRRVLPMARQDSGWFEARVTDAPAGARYAFRIDGGMVVPDPASRCNPDDVHQASQVIDPLAFAWSDEGWRGRPWEHAVIYELHVGTFTRAGTFAAARERLGYLVDLGVTAIELMPIADFPGRCNWGYDGVLPFAPDAVYGTPEELKQLVDAAHARGLMVLVDVVYNHFGPEGNYLHAYAPQFFDPQHHTPWGAAINFAGEASRTVRDFFIHNALYWLEEYHVDGLRFDAVDRFIDDSAPDFLTEILTRVRDRFGRERHVHLVLENDRNQARYLGRDSGQRPLLATAQWNDDMHHALHCLIAGETDGYYADYAERPLWYVGRCLAEGFGYQGETSRYRRHTPRGEPSLRLPASAFVSFMQTHDQVGNRAFGERIAQLAPPRALRAAVACVLLAPSPPLLFMGEEFGASTPFLFFCDFGAELAAAVTQGRRREFGRFGSERAQASIPDPNAAATFAASKLSWPEINASPHCDWLRFYRQCLELRFTHIVPRLPGMVSSGAFEVYGEDVLCVHWTLGDGSRLHLAANFSPNVQPLAPLPGIVIYATDASEAPQAGASVSMLAPQSVVFALEATP